MRGMIGRVAELPGKDGIADFAALPPGGGRHCAGEGAVRVMRKSFCRRSIKDDIVRSMMTYVEQKPYPAVHCRRGGFFRPPLQGRKVRAGVFTAFFQKKRCCRTGGRERMTDSEQRDAETA